MSKKVIWILTMSLAVVLLLAACERSAVAPQTLATPTNSTSGSQPTVPIQDAYKTQTAAGTITALVLTMQPGGPVTTTTGETPTTQPANLTPLAPTLTPGFGGGNPAAPTPTPGKPATYTLQQGEHPYCIARRFNVDPAELLSLNGLTEASATSLQPGLSIRIPQTGNPFPGTRALVAHPASYTVHLDETIYKIACYFGDVDPIYLAAYNNIPAPYTLTTGTVLSIP